MKQIFLAVMVVMVSIFSSSVFAGEFTSVSEYTVVSETPTRILAGDGTSKEESFTVKVKDSSGDFVSGIRVSCMFTDFGSEYPEIFSTEETDKNGMVEIDVPSFSGEVRQFRYASVWVNKDPASQTHFLFWYTLNRLKPAKLVLVDGETELALGELEHYIFVVKNAWGQALQGVEVEVVNGESILCSPPNMISGPSGGVAFNLMAGETAGKQEFRVALKNEASFIQNGFVVSWSAAPNRIEAVSLSGEEDGVPIFETPVGVPLNAVFVVKDINENPIEGISVEAVFPAEFEGTTDVNGQVIVPIPASVYEGFDWCSIWVTNDPSVSLNFKIVYYQE